MSNTRFSAREDNFTKLRRKQQAVGQDIDPLYAFTQLYKTRARFSNYIGYERPLTFEEWNDLPRDSKAAALFVQFYHQITLAWHKVKSFYTPEEDAISEVMKYLLKNVPIIEADPERFTASYIYQVAKNCIYCICHDIKRDRDRWELEMSNLVNVGENESETVDLFDKVAESDTITTELYRRKLWETVENLDDDYKQLIANILDSSVIKGIPRARRAQLKRNLQVLLAKYTVLYSNSAFTPDTFGTMFLYDDVILSAVVKLPDGMYVTYYGEHTANTDEDDPVITFFGPDRDYKYKLSECQNFEVEDIEYIDIDDK